MHIQSEILCKTQALDREGKDFAKSVSISPRLHGELKYLFVSPVYETSPMSCSGTFISTLHILFQNIQSLPRDELYSCNLGNRNTLRSCKNVSTASGPSAHSGCTELCSELACLSSLEMSEAIELPQVTALSSRRLKVRRCVS